MCKRLRPQTIKFVASKHFYIMAAQIMTKEQIKDLGDETEGNCFSSAAHGMPLAGPDALLVHGEAVKKTRTFLETPSSPSDYQS
jgi:hypothetical protein